VNRFIVHALLTALITGLLAYAASKPAGVDRATGDPVLRPTRWFVAVGWLSWGLGVVFAWVFLNYPSSGGTSWALKWGATCLFLVGGLGVILEGKTWIRLESDALWAWSVWRGRRTMRWQDVTRVRFSEMNRWFIVEDAAGQKIRAMVFLRGLPQLVEALESRTPPGMAGKAIREYQRSQGLLQL
jgi:Bacterial PH domain